MHQKGFITLCLLSVSFAFQCTRFQYANIVSNKCDQCHNLCNSGWCKGPSVDDCLVCSNNNHYRDFSTWQCLDSCSLIQKQDVVIQTQLLGENGIFKYCLENQLYIDSYDLQQSIIPTLELGTKEFPFRSLDDAFRTIFNFNYNQTMKFIINIRHGANLTIHSEDMPLVLLNSNIELIPYSDNPLINMKSNLTQIKIYHQGYNRAQSMNGFNPSFSDYGKIIQYNITDKVSKGLIDPQLINSDKNKFVLFNSNLKIQDVKFLEITSKGSSSNALFFTYYGEYKNLTIENCQLNLQQLLFMTQEGGNLRIFNSVIDISSIARILIFQAKTSCALYEHNWIANNFLMDNCTIKGLNQGGYGSLIYLQNPVNVTITNSYFIDIKWVDSQNSMSIEYFQFRCPRPVFTRVIFENNTLQNFDESRLSYITLQINLNEDNIQEASINNNKFINVQYFKPGLLSAIKAGGKNFKVYFNNNSFENIINAREASTSVRIQAEEIIINNLTIQDSVIASFAQFQNKRSMIKNVKFMNISRIKQNQAHGPEDSFMTWTLSQDSVIKSMIFQKCDFTLSRAINMLQSSNITIENMDLIDSHTNENNLLHISMSKDLIFENVTVLNITKSAPRMIALFNVFQLQSWGQNERIMKYTISNLKYELSSISVLNLESYQPLYQESDIIISFRNSSIKNINIKGKESIFKFNPTNQTRLQFYLSDSVFEDNQLELGSMIDLRQNSNNISISNTNFQNNSGMILKTSPYELNDINQELRVNISQTRFYNNWANESLFQVSANSLLTIQNSIFEENFSLGRGSIIFSELKLSRVSISQSLFKKNYAISGGVFFSTLNGFIEVQTSIFIENFALSGGIYYSQNEGYAFFRKNNYTQNLALKGSLIYAINCFNSITISGGQISRNGFQYHPEFQNPQIFHQKLSLMREAEKNSISSYFNKRFIEKLNQIMSIDKNMFKKYLVSNERSHQISMVKAKVNLSGRLLITQQDLLIIAQSQSTIEIRDTIYQNSYNLKETIFIEQSQLILHSFIIQNISSSSASPVTPIILIQSDSILTSSDLKFYNCQSNLIKIQQSQSYFDIFKVQLISSIRNEKKEIQQLITILHSEVNFTNSVFMEIDNQIGIKQNSEQVFDNKTKYEDEVENNELIIVYAKKSNVNFINLKANNFIGKLFFIEQASSLNLSFSNISNGILSNYQFQGTAITLLNSNADIRSSQFYEISGLSGSAIFAQNQPQFYSKTSISVQNSTFERIYSTQRDGGGSIQISNQDSYLVNNTFILNQAFFGSGGALRLLCSVENSNKCKFNVENNYFDKNTALQSGGAIYYNLYSPKGLKNNIFKNNTANYGNQIGSYAFSLKQENNSAENYINLNSGEITQQVLSVGIYDQQGQLVKNDITSEAVLYTTDIDNLQIAGNTKAVANQGIFHFENIIYYARPNYNSTIQISSNVINKAACSQVTGSSCFDLQIRVSFRQCNMGEVLRNNICEPCTKGYYSFNSEDKFCHKCIPKMICNGQNNSMVETGFWRSNSTSLFIYQCPKQDSCEGGIDSKCKVGYKGRMCNECDRDASDGKIYGKTGSFSCQVCPNLGIQIFYTLAIIAGISLYIVYVKSSVLQNPKRNKPQTVLIRILTNYFQAIMIVKEFDLAWPKQVNEMLKIFSSVSSSQEMIISLDCYLNKSQISKIINEFPTFYLKVLLFGLSPIIFGFLSFLVWIMIAFFTKRIKNRDIDIKLNVLSTCFLIVFVLYPTITDLSFSLFQCFQIDNDKYYLRKDFSIQCWTQQHIQMALSIGLPSIIVWVIGFPSFIFYKLYKNKSNFNNLNFISHYGLFFIGLNNDSFFWEVTVQNGRKILFILFNLFLSASKSKIKALLSILVLFLQSQILGRLNPFIDPRFNQVDTQAQYAAILTLFCGMFLVQEQIAKNNDYVFILFIIAIGYNLFFLGLWVFRFTSALIRYNIEDIRQFKYCICLSHLKMLTYEEELDIILKNCSNNQITESPIDREYNLKIIKVPNNQGSSFSDLISNSERIKGQSDLMINQQDIDERRMVVTGDASPTKLLSLNNIDPLVVPQNASEFIKKKKINAMKKARSKGGFSPHELFSFSNEIKVIRTQKKNMSKKIKEENKSKSFD